MLPRRRPLGKPACGGRTARDGRLIPANAVDNNRDARPTADVVIMASRLPILALSKHVEDLRPRSRPLRRESGGIPAQGLVADPLSNTR